MGKDVQEIELLGIIYIGANVIIEKRVKVGSKIIIGANIFVNKDIPNNSKAYRNLINII